MVVQLLGAALVRRTECFADVLTREIVMAVVSVGCLMGKRQTRREEKRKEKKRREEKRRARKGEEMKGEDSRRDRK